MEITKVSLLVKCRDGNCLLKPSQLFPNEDYLESLIKFQRVVAEIKEMNREGLIDGFEILHKEAQTDKEYIDTIKVNSLTAEGYRLIDEFEE